MSNFIEHSCKTFAVTNVFAPYLRVKLNAGVLALATAAESEIGVTEPAPVDQSSQSVRLRNAPGTRIMIAAGAITSGANVYAAATGKIAATGSILVGTALHATTADGDQVEVLPVGVTKDNTVTTVAATGTNQATAAALVLGVNNVTAGDGTTAVVLPAAVAGARVEVYHSVATVALPVFPASGDAINGATADAAVNMEGKTYAIFQATSDANWAAIYTANS